ncbi:MAG: hypothetical protein WCP07_11845 [bacterium]
MLLTTQGGLIVSSPHIAFLALRREETSPRQTDPDSLTYRVLLCLADREGNRIVAARGVSLTAARFVREDIAHHWAIESARWSAEEALSRFRDGAYYAQTGDGSLTGDDETEDL